MPRYTAVRQRGQHCFAKPFFYTSVDIYYTPTTQGVDAHTHTHMNLHASTNMSAADLWDSSLCPQRFRTQRNRESCHIVTNSLPSGSLSTQSHTYRHTLCRTCSGRERYVAMVIGSDVIALFQKEGSRNVYSQRRLCSLLLMLAL